MTQQFLEGTPLEVCGKGSVLNIPCATSLNAVRTTPSNRGGITISKSPTFCD